MYRDSKSLLIRADFVLGNRQGGDRLWCKRWRRVLAGGLPWLLGCAKRCQQAVVWLRRGAGEDGEAQFSAWLRLPIERRPSRRRLRKFKAKLRARLEAGLLPIDGRVLKLGVRRCQARASASAAAPAPPAAAAAVVLPIQPAPVVTAAG